MSLSVELRELLDYTEHERRKWRDWIAANPRRLGLRFQQDGRFPTVGSLLDHIFLVERRHLARLLGETPPEASGQRADDAAGLFAYGDDVRARLRGYLTNFDEETARQTMTVATQSGTRTMTRRSLATHILLHEIRHLAQIAYAARAAGEAPPGEHDFFYFAAAGDRT